MTSEQHRRVYISLYQTHLSRLEGAGFVEYDRVAGVVDPTRATAMLVPSLVETGTLVGEVGDEQSTLDTVERSLWASATCGVALALSSLGLVPSLGVGRHLLALFALGTGIGALGLRVREHVGTDGSP